MWPCAPCTPQQHIKQLFIWSSSDLCKPIIACAAGHVGGFYTTIIGKANRFFYSECVSVCVRWVLGEEKEDSPKLWEECANLTACGCLVVQSVCIINC